MRLILSAFILASLPLLAWENHALLTALAIMDMKEVRDAKALNVETLEAFVSAEQVAITRTLADEEAWALANVPDYPARPVRYAFNYKDPNKSTLLKRFLQALRVNPDTKFALALQELPGRKTSGTNPMDPSKVTLMPKSLPKTVSFTALEPGQQVSAADVFATATDEPDYGLDIKLWSDSGTTYGRAYNFGDQPFGNPKLEYGTQAPFHMGFYHEAGIVNWTAGVHLHTLAEYRIHQFYSLARLAFQSGHTYWGWRFAGMGAHYIQDLTQPYHTKVMPGEGALRLVATGALDLVGVTGPKDDLVDQATSEHQALEKEGYCAALKALKPGAKNDLMSNALRQASDDRQLYKAPYVREVLSSQSHDLADEVAEALRPLMNSKPGCDTPKSIKTEVLFAKLMKNFGQHTRGFIRAILP